MKHMIRTRKFRFHKELANTLVAFGSKDATIALYTPPALRRRFSYRPIQSRQHAKSYGQSPKRAENGCVINPDHNIQVTNDKNGLKKERTGREKSARRQAIFMRFPDVIGQTRVYVTPYAIYGKS